MKRALMTATVPSMIGQFNMNNIKLLQELGYKVDIATNFNDYTVWNQERINKFENELKELNIQTFNISFSRNPKDIKNLMNSYKQMKQLFDNQEYTLIHTHTPISSLITRLAYKRSNIYEACKMIYTAHGFHFFKGNNPIKNLIFRNIEKIGAKYTDVLITINKEDYEAAKRFKLKKNGKVEYVPGVGIDLNKINSIKGDKRSLCKRLGIPLNTTLVLSVGELNSNKNHKIIIEALSKLPQDIHYLICGLGPNKNYYKELANKLIGTNRLHLLGYREDIINIMKSCDIFAFPSLREGLGLAAIEAMASGLPIVTSNRGGILDYSKNGVTGYSCDPNDMLAFKNAIESLYRDSKLRQKMSRTNKNLAMNYDISIIKSRMEEIYKSI